MKNYSKGSLFESALNLYFETIFKPLKEKLFSITISMIRDERLNKLVTRSKIKDLIKIYEEIDLENGQLIKLGDDLLWSGKENFEISNEFLDKYLIPEVKIRIYYFYHF